MKIVLRVESAVVLSRNARYVLCVISGKTECKEARRPEMALELENVLNPLEFDGREKVSLPTLCKPSITRTPFRGRKLIP